MKTISFLLACLISMILTTGNVCAQKNGTIDIEKASTIFNETRQICALENGLLWGHTLDVPLIFLDTNSRMIVSNRKDSDGLLESQQDVFVGRLPETIHQTKGTIQLGGKTWALIPWPLPDDFQERQSIIIHEAFHCLQPQLDMKPLPYMNEHMKEMEARFWLKLEWQALATAIHLDGKERKRALTDALSFRLYRRAVFSSCDECENRFEIHEGMAEYTAQRICRSKVQLEEYLEHNLAKIWNSSSFENCFAYCSGPLYGYLLDETGIDWRNNLGARDNLADLIVKAYNLTLPEDIYLEAEERSVFYHGAQIMGEELDRSLEL